MKTNWKLPWWTLAISILTDTMDFRYFKKNIQIISEIRDQNSTTKSSNNLPYILRKILEKILTSQTFIPTLP